MDKGDPRVVVPAQVGKYTVLGHLATGGMAEVYLARQQGIEGFEKMVVLKRVRGDLAMDRHAINLFLEEARLGASLAHPNITQVYEIDVFNGQYFLAMEYVYGADLRQVLERARRLDRPLDLADAIYIMIEVCKALHYAHDKRGADGAPLHIIHRDVSPSNVLVGHDGSVKLCDFGVAKAANRDLETRRGVLKGKLQYMSPEQCRAEPLDRRTDIFAAGILLFEATTMTPLFRADNDFDVMRMIIEDPLPSPGELVNNYPPALAAIVARALARDRDARYPTAQQLQLALEGFARDHRLATSSVHVQRLMADLFQIGERMRAKRDTKSSLGVAATAPMSVVTPRVNDPSHAFSPVDVADDPTDVDGEPMAMQLDPPNRDRGLASEFLARGSGESDAGGLTGKRSSQQIVQIERPAPVPVPARVPSQPMVQVAPPPPSVARAPSRADHLRFAALTWPWLLGVVLGIATAFGGPWLAGSRQEVDPADRDAINTIGHNLEVELASELAAVRARATNFSELPALRAAIETDAATLVDMLGEGSVKRATAETIEIFRNNTSGRTLWARLPDGAPPLPKLDRPAQLVVDATTIVMVASEAAIAGQANHASGTIIVARRYDSGRLRSQLDAQSIHASLRIGDREFVYFDGTPASSPMPVQVAEGASLIGYPRVVDVTPGWATPVRYSGFAFAGLCVVALAVALARRR